MSVPELSEPKLLFERGHTLSLIKFRNAFLGYLGHVGFEKIDIYQSGNEDFYFMEKVGEIPNARWGSAIVTDRGVRLYFARQNFVSKLPLVNPYRSQTIYSMDSQDGVHFNFLRRVAAASAPFAFRDGHQIMLACHKRDYNQLQIIAPECYLEMLTFGKHTVSAPSIVFFHGLYWLTCEHLNKNGVWNTLLFSGKNLLNLKIVSTKFIVNGACAFQHLFGSQYILTYSMRKKHSWCLMVKEGTV